MQKMPVQIRPLTAAAAAAEDSAWLRLNNAHAEELSFLTAPRFAHLVGQAFYAATVGERDALLIAFDQSADYDSVNFLWFKERFPHFVYVDRVVVDPAARGGGFARALYLELFERARAAGHGQIVCEVNSHPPNPGSERFHAGFGFKEVGSATIANGAKTVRYYAKQL